MKNKMKKIVSLILALVTLTITLSVLSVPASAASAPAVRIHYRTHCQNIGWTNYACNGGTSGTEGQELRLEGIQMFLAGVSGSVVYRVHCQDIGWMEWTANGGTAGTTGRSLRVEAIQINLSGEVAKYYDVVYRTHCQDIGWTDWTSNGGVSGTTGKSLRMEAIQVKLVAKSATSDEWQMPMKGNVITTQAFGKSGHLGIDIKSTTNSTVYAAADGKVVATGLNGTGADASTISNPKGNGYYVVIEHTIGGKKVYSMYGHLKSDSIKVKAGQNIQKGTEIGTCGNTGNSTGAHLHFAIADTYRAGSYYGYTSSRKTFNSDSMYENRSGITFFNPMYVINNDKLS